MKKHLLIILLTVICAGCKKKNDPRPPVLITGMKFVAPGTPDSLVNIYSYSYNSQNKLSNVNVVGSNFAVMYNAGGELISYGDSGNGYGIQVQYDQNNNPVSCTITNYDYLSRPEQTYYFAYVVVNGVVTQTNQLNSPNGAVLTTAKYTYDRAGNIIEEDDLNANGTITGTTKSTYGTHYSPFYTSRLKFMVPGLSQDYTNPNEVLTSTSVNGLGTTQFVYTYTYNGLYPTSRVISTIGNNVKNFYYYTYSGL